jgi:hypothetical protein
MLAPVSIRKLQGNCFFVTLKLPIPQPIRTEPVKFAVPRYYPNFADSFG